VAAAVDRTAAHMDGIVFIIFLLRVCRKVPLHLMLHNSNVISPKRGILTHATMEISAQAVRRWASYGTWYKFHNVKYNQKSMFSPNRYAPDRLTHIDFFMWSVALTSTLPA
jgi:hypothetical protein